jgi:putative PIN family toxin of toxin-antitoxin system
VRVVLDTNVCLDAFVFADPRVAALVEALAAGTLEAVTRADCRDEWLAVLGYPALKLDLPRRDTAAAAFDRVVTLLPYEPVTAALPRCRDPDDQKFLELASTSGAGILFSRDAEVLKLARRAARDSGFRILRPQDWTAGTPVPA